MTNIRQPITVNTSFDAGSIEVIDLKDCNNLQFRIKADTNSHFRQWFYFQLSNVYDKSLTINLVDMEGTAYPEGWVDYNVCFSYDNVNWQRLPSSFSNNTLTFGLVPEANTIYFAYFEPYSYTRHLELIGEANQSPVVSHQVLGQTAQGRNIDLLVVGFETAPIKVWFTARQHPGETMAEWFMEGLIHKILSLNDPLGVSLLRECVFYLVPNMNPDGSASGNLRVNTKGVNLNREWLEPSIEKSPEVYFVRNKMMEVGVDMSFDVHGDEAIPYLFTAGCEENPNFSDKQKQQDEIFKNLFLNICPEYQTKHGYEKGHYSDESRTIATNWIGEYFDCLAYTIEMPFKDNLNLPNEEYGWDGNRSYLLGQIFLSVIYAFLCNIKPALRTARQ